MIRPGPIIFALLAGALVFGVVDLQHKRIAALTAEKAAIAGELAVAATKAEQVQQAADVLAGHYKRLADSIIAFDGIRSNLATVEGRNAPVSPLVAATLGCLRASRGENAVPCP